MMGFLKGTSSRLLTAAVFLLLISVILYSVWSDFNKPADPIKIGLSNTLTGPASTSGIHSRNAVILAVDQINKSGGIKGRPLELIIKDDKGQADEAVRVDRELINEGVIGIIGHYLSTLSVKAAGIVSESRVPMISTGATTPELGRLDDFFLRLMVPDNLRTQFFADLVYERLKIKTMAIITDLSNPNYTIPFSRHFRKNFTELGGSISSAVRFNSLEKYSASEIANQVTASNSDGVLLVTNAINGALLSQRLRIIDPEIKLIVSPWALPEVDFIKNGGQAIEGAISLVELDLESSNSKFRTFRAQYQTRYNEELSLNGYVAYEAAQIFFEALAKTENPADLKKNILEQGNFEGLIDQITLDSFGDPIRPLYIVEVQNSLIRTIGKMER
ncbi:MAG: ABC transporter substrate-binding protein [SAR324 cluster bacterium]|nr:ABC transporter substrate-binding protein [SAR324 cluster bacterium]